MSQPCLNAKIIIQDELEIIFDRTIQVINIDDDYVHVFLKNLLPCLIPDQAPPELLPNLRKNLAPVLMAVYTQRQAHLDCLEGMLEIDVFRWGRQYFILMDIPWYQGDPRVIKILA